MRQGAFLNIEYLYIFDLLCQVILSTGEVFIS